MTGANALKLEWVWPVVGDSKLMSACADRVEALEGRPQSTGQSTKG